MATDTGNLTSKQESFAQAVADGLNHSDAYRHAYDTGSMKSETVWNNAYQLTQVSDVAARIKELQAQLTEIRSESKLWDINRAMTEVETNIRLARFADQHGPARSSTRDAIELSGLTQGPAQADIHITKVTVVLSGAIEAIEAEVIELEPSQPSLEDSEVP